MVCNWLTSNYHPKQDWYFALCAAAQVSNYMPILTEDGIWINPFEVTYGKKPDWRNLMPMFLLAYIKQSSDGNKQRASTDSQSIK
eukprot:5856761-Ditylum_brightwellii.AAC.1